jgi:hypothetical protein
MKLVTSWFGLLKLALIIGVAVSAVYTFLDILYVNEASATGIDPLEAASNWNPVLALAFLLFGLVAAGAGIFLVVASIGFVFRAAQWLKGQDNSAVRFKPGWAIAGYIIPVTSVIIPFMFQWDLNKGGYHSEESKKQTKTLLITTLVCAAISSILFRSGLTDLVLVLSGSTEEISFEDFISNEWKSIYGSLFDIAGMTALFFAVRSIYAGLVKRSQATA